MNGLAGLARVLETGTNEVPVDAAPGLLVHPPIDRMLAFTAVLKEVRRGYVDALRRGLILNQISAWCGVAKVFAGLTASVPAHAEAARFRGTGWPCFKPRRCNRSRSAWVSGLPVVSSLSP